MKIAVTDEFKQICSRIVNEAKSEVEWAAIESDDMFQTANYIGGFDATEMEFCFSYYDSQQREFWFQLPVSAIKSVAEGVTTDVEARLAEK